MSTAQIVSEVAKRVVAGTATERENAIALHDYIRENVQFGFTKYFGVAEPSIPPSYQTSQR